MLPEILHVHIATTQLSPWRPVQSKPSSTSDAGARNEESTKKKTNDETTYPSLRALRNDGVPWACLWTSLFPHPNPSLFPSLYPSLLPSLPPSPPLFVRNFPCNRQDPRTKPAHKSFQHITSTPAQRREESSRSSSSVALAYFPASLAETQAARERAFPLHNLLLLHRQAPPVSNLFSNIYTCRRFDCSRVSGKRIHIINVSSVW